MKESTFATKIRKADKRERSSENRYRYNASPFYATCIMFRDYIGYTEPLSFEEWSSLDDDKKAAALFVQFFEQITLAWHKVKSFYTLEEDGVSTMMQYLLKNVPVIEDKPSRFSAAYIYRVAYNCLYCICHDIKVDRDRYEKEMSNIQTCGDNNDDEIDLFNTVVTDEDVVDVIDRERFWELIEDMGEDTIEVVNKLINGNHPRGRKNTAIIEELRIRLVEYKDRF